MDVFASPVVLNFKEPSPIAVLWLAVLFLNALLPTAVFELLLVTCDNAPFPKAVFEDDITLFLIILGTAPAHNETVSK